MEDELMRLFANAGPLSTMLDKSMIEGEPLEHTSAQLQHPTGAEKG